MDRDAALTSFTRIGYEVVDEFELTLEDGSTAKSFALKKPGQPEIFISSGPDGSKIHKWVTNRNGPGAVHHFAYSVINVQQTMDEWREQGVEFQTDRPLVCPCDIPLIQVFTKPDPSTGLIYELITRNGHPGFCAANVKRLMEGSPE